MQLFSLEGKTALITGSSRGIGKAIALRMAEAGANVIVSSRKAEPCAKVVAKINDNGGNAVAVPCNVSDPAALPQFAKDAQAAFGHVDIFVGNAAANPYHGPTLGIDEPAFDKIVSTNVKANLWLCKSLLPQMAERRDGAVILISSIAAHRGTTDLAAYGMSKAAEESLARSLAVEWGPHNIRVNCIAPGLIKTDFARALWEDETKRKSVEAVYPLRRLGDPDDIAGIAVCLASPAGAFMTGQTLVVDGGVTIASGR